MMKMKNFGITVLVPLMLAPFTVLRIEGMESVRESRSAALLTHEEQEELDLSDSFFLPPSSCFGNLFVDAKEIEQNPAKAATLYREILQAGHIREFGIRIKEICKLEIYWVEKEPTEGLNSNFDSLPTNQCFKDPYETLKFLRLLEEPGSKHEPNLREFRKDDGRQLELLVDDN